MSFVSCESSPVPAVAVASGRGVAAVVSGILEGAKVVRSGFGVTRSGISGVDSGVASGAGEFSGAADGVSAGGKAVLSRERFSASC